MNKKYFSYALALLLSLIFVYFLVQNDAPLYRQPLAKITAVTNSHTGSDRSGTDLEITFQQTLTAIRLNGPQKGETLQLQNTASNAQVFNEYYEKGNQVFLKNGLSGAPEIAGLKRDASLIYIAALFSVVIVALGGDKGAKSLMSVIANLIIFAGVIYLYLNGVSLMVLAPISSVLFVVVSITLVAGVNQKSFSAIVGTLAGTFIAIGLAVLVIRFTGAKGVHYEEMEFLTRSPVEIFLFGLLVGTLGAIMDIAISISSAVSELVELNPRIERAALIRSGLTIGNDIVGTMANTLVFAYISGGVPTMLLYLFNGFSLSYLLSVILSLDIIRALVGSIGIVLSIPVTLFIAVFFAMKTQPKEVR